MKTATYGAFSDKIHRAGVSSRIPLNGTFEMTHRCPLTSRLYAPAIPKPTFEASIFI